MFFAFGVYISHRECIRLDVVIYNTEQMIKTSVWIQIGIAFLNQMLLAGNFLFFIIFLLHNSTFYCTGQHCKTVILSVCSTLFKYI